MQAINDLDPLGHRLSRPPAANILLRRCHQKIEAYPQISHEKIASTRKSHRAEKNLLVCANSKMPPCSSNKIAWLQLTLLVLSLCFIRKEQNWPKMSHYIRLILLELDLLYYTQSIELLTADIFEHPYTNYVCILNLSQFVSYIVEGMCVQCGSKKSSPAVC